MDRVVDLVWRDTTPLTGNWGDGFSVRWRAFVSAPASGEYTLRVEVAELDERIGAVLLHLADPQDRRRSAQLLGRQADPPNCQLGEPA